MKNRESSRCAAILNTIRRRSMTALCLLLVVQIILAAALPVFAAAAGDVVLVTSASPKVYSGAGTGYSSVGSAVGGKEYTYLSKAQGTDGAQ